MRFYDALDEDKKPKFEMIHKKGRRKLHDYRNKRKIFSDDLVENKKGKI